MSAPVVLSDEQLSQETLLGLVHFVSNGFDPRLEQAELLEVLTMALRTSAAEARLSEVERERDEWKARAADYKQQRNQAREARDCITSEQSQVRPKDWQAGEARVEAAERETARLRDALEPLVRHLQNSRCCEVCGRFALYDRIEHSKNCDYAKALAALSAATTPAAEPTLPTGGTTGLTDAE